jgi:hypothetical protein
MKWGISGFASASPPIITPPTLGGLAMTGFFLYKSYFFVKQKLSKSQTLRDQGTESHGASQKSAGLPREHRKDSSFPGFYLRSFEDY